MSKTSICSIVALDIIDYAKKTEVEQLEIKSRLESLIQQAVGDIAESNRVVVNTGQGAVIACCGSMEDSLEDALLIALTMRDEILKSNAVSFKPMYIQFGINIGSVLLNNKAGEPDVAGAGVDEAQRIMSFANPNQILVSRVYYEMASKVTQEISAMFEHYDMHAHEQEIFAVRLHKEQLPSSESLEIPVPETVPDKWLMFFRNLNWTYASISVFLMVGLVLLARNAMAPHEPIITMDAPSKVESTQQAKAEITSSQDIAKQTPASSMVSPTDNMPEVASPGENKPAETAVAQSSTEKSSVAKSPQLGTKPKVLTRDRERKPDSTIEMKSVTAPASTEAHDAAAENKTQHQAAVTTNKSVNAKAENASDKSTWQSIKDSVKRGTDHRCSQAQVAMNQCN